MPRLYLPDLILANGRASCGVGLLVADDGSVLGEATPESAPHATRIRLTNKALLPGLANAHSHTFQRLFRARAEGRRIGGDTFWTWREQMYRAAAFCAPGDLYDVARATFLEMLASGITLVGEFHYLHNDPAGNPYADPNELAHQVIRAAQSVGIRICLLRAAYMRAGFEKAPHPGQRRFYESEDAYLRNLEALIKTTAAGANVTVGSAPHSIRAVPLPAQKNIAAFAQSRELPLHLHISEQPAENSACLAEYGQTPVALVAAHGILTPRTTLVHAIHLTESEFAQVAAAGNTICSCPTTERNLGDGIFPADTAARLGISVAYGTDSQAQIDILEDARQNEYHLRLIQRERGILDQFGDQPIAARLFTAATANGYRALGVAGGSLAAGQPADFFTVSLDDPALLGVDVASLESQAVFALNRAAIRDVAVAGVLVLTDGHHPLDDEIRTRYRAVQQRFATQEAS
ncbi:MAG TPA: formimidoylglutamate deiminase [Terracidiphilus sp.]|jgi:formimidoylglutamate deiminase|nr:formimidoylglutamate deiminase [Terracidiphilus sp.]